MKQRPCCRWPASGQPEKLSDAAVVVIDAQNEYGRGATRKRHRDARHEDDENRVVDFPLGIVERELKRLRRQIAEMGKNIKTAAKAKIVMASRTSRHAGQSTLRRRWSCRGWHSLERTPVRFLRRCFAARQHFQMTNLFCTLARDMYVMRDAHDVTSVLSPATS